MIYTAILMARDCLVMLLLSVVFLQICDDVPLRNADFSMLWTVVNNTENLRVGEGTEALSLAQVNQIEINFLKRLDFHVFIETDAMDQVVEELLALAATFTQHDT